MSEFLRSRNRIAENSLLRPAQPERAAGPAREVTPQPWGNRAARQFAESCPSALPSPGVCPLGGACHACPARVQAKLEVSKPDDPYEQEADRVAEQVMTMPEPKVQRACPSCEDETVQTQPLADQITPLVQRQEEPEEEKPPEEEEEEEPAQAKLEGGILQRQEESPKEEEEEEPAQTKSEDGVLQRREENSEEEEEGPVQAKSADASIQRQEENPVEEEETAQMKWDEALLQRRGDTKEEVDATASGQEADNKTIVFCSPKKEKARNTLQKIKSHAPTRRIASTLELVNSQTLKSGGSPLPEKLRGFYQSRFHRELGSVRLHMGLQAHKLNSALKARAFTLSNHIWLGRDLPVEPSLTLAHELTHFIQQRQPPRILSGVEAAARVDEITTRGDGPAPARITIQRFPFWVPLSNSKGVLAGMSGTAIHKELLGAVKGKKKIDIEAPVPNANRKDYGVGLYGSADLYRSSNRRRVGIYFKARQGVVRGTRSGGADWLFEGAANHPKAGKGAAPRVENGKIVDIANAPDDIHLGELKPANSDELQKGDTQLDNYINGFVDAQSICNDWAHYNGARKWTMTRPKRLEKNDVVIPKKYKFSGRPKTDRFLGLADHQAVFRERGRLNISLLWPRNADEASRIKGGLYFEHYGNGLWTYFARPADLAKDLNLTGFRAKELPPAMELATQIQEEVIDQIKRGPDKIGRSLDTERSRIPSRGRLDVPLITPVGKKSHIQRKSKSTFKLVDNFNYAVWSKRQKQLGAIIRKNRKGRGAGNTPIGKALASLHLIELAYEANDGLRSSPHSSAAVNLPPKGTLIERRTSGKTKVKLNLAKAYSWMTIWTGTPVRRILGKLRKVFGGTFVSLANKFDYLKRRFQKLAKSIFHKSSASSIKGGGTYAIILRRFIPILSVVLGLLLRQTSNYLVDALSRGAKEWLAKIIPVDIGALKAAAKDGFKQYLPWMEKLIAFRKSVLNFIDGVVGSFSGILKGIGEIISKISKIVRIVNIAKAAIQCGTPPGIGCVKLLLKPLEDALVGRILSTCWVQRKIARLLLSINFIKSIPRSLAKYIAEKANALLSKIHPQLSPVFADIRSGSLPKAEEIGCGGEPSEEHKLLAEIIEKLGDRKYEEIKSLLEQFTIRDKSPLSKQDIKDMRDWIAKGNLNNLADWLRAKRSKQLRQRLEGGGFNVDFRKLQRRHFKYWVAPLSQKEVDERKAYGKTFLHISNEGRKYVGIADIEITKCTGQDATIRFLDVRLTDSEGQSVDLGLKGEERHGKLTQASCRQRSRTGRRGATGRR
jgi:hypothetical protein